MSASCTVLLAQLWDAGRVECEDKASEAALSQLTTEAMIASICGAVKCEVCGVGPHSPTRQLEGHHHKSRRMYISEYRHCIKQKFRRRAMRRLASELVHRVVMLCKSCHETVHHGPSRLVRVSETGYMFLACVFQHACGPVWLWCALQYCCVCCVQVAAASVCSSTCSRRHSAVDEGGCVQCSCV